MPRGSWKKRWIKLYVTGWLHGSIRWQFTSEERGVWADLMALAGEIQRGGEISDNDGKPLPRDYIANTLNIKQILLDRVIAKSIHEGRIVDRDSVLFLTNYESYQSEYERQKPYRQSQQTEPEYTYDMYAADHRAVELAGIQGDELAVFKMFRVKYQDNYVTFSKLFNAIDSTDKDQIIADLDLLQTA